MIFFVFPHYLLSLEVPLTRESNGKWQEAKEGVFPHPESSESSTSCFSLGWLAHFFPATTLRAVTLYVDLSLLRFYSCKTCPLLPGLCYPALWLLCGAAHTPTWLLADASSFFVLVIFPHISSGRVFTFVLSSVLQETKIPLVYFPPPSLSLNAVKPGQVRCGT